MVTEAPLVATAAAKGTSAGISAGVGSTLSAFGTGIKIFALAHPVSLVATGGVLLGLGGYHAVSRWRKKHAEEEVAEEEAAAPAAA